MFINNILRVFKLFIKTNVYAILLPFKVTPISYTFYCLLNIFKSAYPIVIVYIWSYMIDEMVILYYGAEVYTSILFLTLLYVGLLISSRITRTGISMIHSYQKDKMQLYIDTAVMNKMSAIDPALSDDPRNINKVDAALNSTIYVVDSAYWPIAAVSSVISLIAAGVIFLSVDIFAGIIFLATYIPGAVITYINGKKMDQLSIETISETREKEYYKKILTSIDFAKDIRLYGIKDNLIEKHNYLWKTIRLKRNIVFTKSFILSCLALVLSYSGFLFIILRSAIAVYENSMMLGTMVMFIGLAHNVSSNLTQIFIDFGIQINVASQRIQYYMDFMAWKPSIYENNGLCVTPFPEIRFENVSFRYPNSEKYTLKNISLTLKSKEKIALVGINGAGKSTIVKLLLRFHDPEEGRILLNGIDAREYSLSSLRSLFSVCFQSTFNYSLAIDENISLSSSSDEGMIMEAMQNADISSIFEDNDEGVKMPLTRKFEDNGLELSGGQWQKIGVARTFYRDADIVILDEPSSALDPQAEENVLNAFKRICKEKSGLIISHRLSCLHMVDNIYVIENGVIAESGSHGDLMTMGGRYAQLYNLQSSKYKI